MAARAELFPTLEASRVTKEEWREFTKTVWQIANVTHPLHPAVFPEEIPTRLIKLFSFVGETVLDPFAGIGTTAKVALKLGREAIAIEQNHEYCREMKNLYGTTAQIVEGSSRVRLSPKHMAEGSVALIVTSPPYWNKANYGDGTDNLGNEASYPRFFARIRPVFEECLRVLAPGRKLCLVTANVNQYTDQGLLTFPLAADFAGLLRDVGFMMVNEVIWSKDGTGGRWGSANAQRPIFGSYPYPPNFLFKNVHEHILIFAKPLAHPKKGPKALSYADVMRP